MKSRVVSYILKVDQCIVKLTELYMVKWKRQYGSKNESNNGNESLEKVVVD